ncbi:MAG: hypothetical protein KA393_09245 [Limnohabitans sp.]|jgi:acetyl esterase/lipase|nr:hypothetical protein [Limnohabitans sp.]
MDFTAEGDFSETAITRGIKANEATCKEINNGLWATSKDHGSECIRYWMAGLDPTRNEKVMVFFHGDIWVGAGKTNKNYLALSQDKLAEQAAQIHRQLGVPYVFIGRPGTHGSSGDHMQRRREMESRQINAALDVLKQLWAIKEFVIAGQSGGGHVTASLLTMRSDIVCAVPTSAPSSPSIRWKLYGRTRDTTGYADSYEPTDKFNKTMMHPDLRVFMVGDPEDANVLWPSQIVLADKLAAQAIPVEVIKASGTGPDRHGLSNSGRKVASWCLQDIPTEKILQKARGLKG